jgi:hypothetical protein
MPTTLNFGEIGIATVEDTLDESQIPQFLAENGDAIRAALLRRRQEENEARTREEAAQAPDTFMEEAGSAAAQLGREAAGVVGKAVTAAGTLAAPMAPMPAFFDPSARSLPSAWQAPTGQERIRAIEESGVTKAGRAIEEAGAGLPVLPASEQRIPGKFFGAVGATLGIAPAALAGPAAPFVAGGVYGLSAGQAAADEARETTDRQIAELLAEGDWEGARALQGERESRAQLAFAATAPIGAVTEGALGVVGGAASKLPFAKRAAEAVVQAAARRVGPRAARAAGGAVVGGVSEALQEGSESVLSDIAAKAVYDPDRAVGAQLVEEALYGGGVGALFGGARGALSRKPVARAVPPDAPRTVTPAPPMPLVPVNDEAEVAGQGEGGAPGAGAPGATGLLPGGGGVAGLLPAPRPTQPRVFTPPYTGPGRDVIVTPYTGATQPGSPGRQQLRRAGVEAGLFSAQGEQAVTDESGRRVATVDPSILEEGLGTAETENVPSPIDEAILDGTLKRQLNLPENVANSYSLAGAISGRYLNGENVDPDVLSALDEALSNFLRTLEGRINGAIERNVNEREVDALIGLHQRLTQFGVERRNDAAFLALQEEQRYQEWLQWAAGGRKGDAPSKSSKPIGRKPPSTPTPPTPTTPTPPPAPNAWTEETMDADAQSVGGPGAITPGDAPGTAVLDRPAGLGRLQVITGKPWMADAPRDPDVTAEGVWVLMEADDVVTSFQGNAYNQKIQPRVLDTVERQEKADEYGRDLRGHRLAESGTTDTGGIIIDEKAQAISGNNRLRGVRRAISGTLGKAGFQSMERYKAWLRKNAASLGFTPEQVDSMRNPMAFRLALSYPNTTKLRFAETANDAPAISPTIIDAAVRVADAIRRDPTILLKLNPSETGSMMVKQNEPFMRLVQSLSGMSEKFQDPKGELNDQIEPFANKALLAYLFGSKDYRDTAFIIERAGDFGFRQAINGIAKNAGMLAQLAGTAYELGSVFRDAFKAIVDIKSSGLSVEEYVDQATLGIGGQEDPETKALVGVLMGIQSAKEADEVFKFYAESAQKALKDLAVGGGLWGGAEIPGRPQVLSVAARKARDARQARAEDAARRKKQKEEEDGKATGQGGRTEQGEGAGKGGGAPEGQGDAEGDGAGGGSGDAEGKTEGGGAPDGQGDADGDGDGGDGEGAGGKKKAGRGPRIKKPKAPKTTEGTGKGPKTTEGTTPPPTTPPTTPPPSESFLSAEEEAAIDAEFAKLRATYSGADPEIIVIGIRIANIYIKAGVRSFARYAGHVKSKAPDLWERLKPHLASFWNSAIVGVDDAEEVTPSQARAIIADIDKPPGGGGGTPPPTPPPTTPPPPPGKPKTGRVRFVEVAMANGFNESQAGTLFDNYLNDGTARLNPATGQFEIDAGMETPEAMRKVLARAVPSDLLSNLKGNKLQIAFLYETSKGPAYAVTGETRKLKESLSRAGGRWNNPLRRWEFGRDSLNALREILPKASEGGDGSQRPVASHKTDPKLRGIRERADGRPDESGDPRVLRESVSADTAGLLRAGIAQGIPENVVNEQVEDVGAIARAHANGRRLFLLGNDAGTGKTFVLGGAIRELRRKGARRIVWVTPNKDLIRQAKEDLAKFGVDDIEFMTYAKFRETPPRDTDALVFDEAHYVKHSRDAKQGSTAQMWMRQAKFTIMASATPYEDPTQMEYVAGTGVFDEVGGFLNFAAAFGATVKRDASGEIFAVDWDQTQTFMEDAKAGRDYMRKLGIFVQRPMRLPLEQIETSLTPVPIDPKYGKILDDIERVAEATATDFDFGNTQKWLKMFRKRLLEYGKVQAGIDMARQAMAEGRWPIIFLETRSERIYNIPEILEKEREFLAAKAMAQSMRDTPPKRADYGLPPKGAVAIFEAYMNATGNRSIELPAMEDVLKEAFGPENTAIFTGSETEKGAQRELARWRQAPRPMVLVATMAKGGTGLSLHDRVGNHPTTQVNIILPWTASKVTQVTQRSARYGLKGVARINWLFVKDSELDRSLAGRVGQRMQSMGSLVRGEVPKVTMDIANFNIGEEMDTVGEEGETATAGTVRLYRAQPFQRSKGPTPEWIASDVQFQNTVSSQGRWFTDDLEEAKWYLEKEYPDGQVVYVDVPASEVEQFRVSNIPRSKSSEAKDNPAFYSRRPDKEFFLPANWIEKYGAAKPVQIVTPTQGPVSEALDNLKTAWTNYSNEAQKMGIRADPRETIRLQFKVYAALYKFAEAAIKVGAQSAADLARMAGVRLNGLVSKAWDHAKAGIDFEQYVPDDQDAVDLMEMGGFIDRLDRAAGRARAEAGDGPGAPTPPPEFQMPGTGRTARSEGLFKGRYETMTDEQVHAEAVRWVDAYGSDLEAALSDAMSGNPDLGMDNRGARNYVMLEIMARARNAAKTSPNAAVAQWILGNFLPRAAKAYSANATEAGRELGAINLAQARYSYLNPMLTLLNLIKERQRRLPFPEINSQEIREWLKGVRRRVVEEILRETSQPDNLVKRVFNRTARDMGINWREIMESSLEVQRNVYQAIYDSILAHPILSRMPDPARVELANLLGRQFQAKRDEIAKREIAKYVAPKANKKTQEALVNAFPRILKWANLGVLDDANFRDAVAPFFGVASLDSGIVQEITDMAQQAQAVGGENRKRILMDMYRRIQEVGGVRWGDVIQDYWYASVLSGTRTQVDGGMNVINGFIKTAALGLATPRKLDFFKAYGSGVADAAGDFFPILLRNDVWKSKAWDGERAPNALEALANSRNAFARVISNLKYVSRIMSALDHLNGLGTYRAGLVDALARTENEAAINRFLTPTAKDLADARTTAENEGTQPDRMKARVREILEQQLPAEVILDAQALMKAMNYTNMPKGFAGMVYRLSERMARSEDRLATKSGAGFVSKLALGTGFLRFATNMFNDYSDFMVAPAMVRWMLSRPGGRLAEEYRPIERRLLVAKAGIGAALGAFAATLFLGDDDDEDDRTIDITGSFKGLTPEKRKQLLAEGRKPYSVRVGDKYYSYRQFGFGSILGVIGELRDRQLFEREKWDQEAIYQKWADAAAAGLLVVTDSTAISGLTEFLGASNAYKYDSQEIIEKRLPRYFSRLAGSFVPNLLKEVDAWSEPSIFKAQTGGEYFVQQVPFLRRTVGPGPVLNVLGEPVAIERYPWSRWITARKDDAAWQTLGTLASKGVFLPTIGKRMVVNEDGTRREMTPAEEHRFQKAVGRAYREFVMENRFDLTTMPKAEAAAFIDKQTERIRNRTAKEMFGY